MSKKITAVAKLRFKEFNNNGDVCFENGDAIFRSINNKNHDSKLPVLAITQEYGAIPREQINYNISVTEKSLDGYKVVEIGDFIISLRSFQGGIEYSEYNGICSPAYIVLRKKKPVVDFYYKYYFKTFRFIRDLNKNLEGIRDGKMVSYSDFSAILLPNPLNKEQQKIADCLSSLDELIEAENKKLEALQKHKKGLMQKLFPADGSSVPEWRFPDFVDSNQWETITLDEFAKYRRGSFPQPYGLSKWYDDENGMPFIQVYDVGENLQLKQDTKSKISHLAMPQSVFVTEGTLIITIQGSIGKVAITQYDAYIDRTLLLFEKFYKEIDKRFIAYALQMLFDVEKRKAPGEIIKTITKEALSSFIIKIPHITEQEKIAKCLDEVTNLIVLQEEKLKTLKKHKTGLLQGLFPAIEEVYK